MRKTPERLTSASISGARCNPRELGRLVVGRVGQAKPGGLLRRAVPVAVGRCERWTSPGCLEIDRVTRGGEVAVGEWI